MARINNKFGQEILEQFAILTQTYMKPHETTLIYSLLLFCYVNDNGAQWNFDKPFTVASFHNVLNFNRVSSKLNRFICN